MQNRQLQLKQTLNDYCQPDTRTYCFNFSNQGSHEPYLDDADYQTIIDKLPTHQAAVYLNLNHVQYYLQPTAAQQLAAAVRDNQSLVYFAYQHNFSAGLTIDEFVTALAGNENILALEMTRNDKNDFTQSAAYQYLHHNRISFSRKIAAYTSLDALKNFLLSKKLLPLFGCLDPKLSLDDIQALDARQLLFFHGRENRYLGQCDYTTTDSIVRAIDAYANKTGELKAITRTGGIQAKVEALVLAAQPKFSFFQAAQSDIPVPRSLDQNVTPTFSQ